MRRCESNLPYVSANEGVCVSITSDFSFLALIADSDIDHMDQSRSNG